MFYEIKDNFFNTEVQKEINRIVYDPELPLDSEQVGDNASDYFVSYIGPNRFYPEALKKYLNGEEIEISNDMLIDLFIFEGVELSREQILKFLISEDLDITMEQTVLFEDQVTEACIPNSFDFIPCQEFLYKNLIKKIGEEFPVYKDTIPIKTIIKQFSCWDFEMFHHEDKPSTTFLYFTNLEYDVERRGAVDFLSDGNEIVSIQPFPNRIVRYDSSVKSRHNPFIHINDKHDLHKFVIEIKYEIPFE